MTTAHFKITGSTSGQSLSAAGGHNAVNGETLTFQLEDSPALDVLSCTYTVQLTSKNATTITPAGGGVASPVTAGVTCAMPGSGTHTYMIRCTCVTASGTIYFERVVAILSPNGFRKILVAEVTQYDTVYGWAGAQNDLVDAFQGAVIGVVAATPNTVPMRDGSAGLKATYLDSGSATDLLLKRGGTTILAVGSNSLYFDLNVATPQFGQQANTADVPCNDFYLKPQAPFPTATGANRNPGNLLAYLADPVGGSTTRPLFQVLQGGTRFAAMGKYDQGNPVDGAIWLGTAAVGQTNFAFLSDGSTFSYFNAPSGGTIELSLGGVAGTGITITSSLTTIQNTFLQVGPTASGPATTGTVRMINATTMRWRNAGNTADIIGVSVSGSDHVLLGDANAAGVDLTCTGNVTINASTSLQLGSANYAQSGYIRGTSTVTWKNRNFGNTADVTVIGTNSSNIITIGGDANNAGVLTTLGAATNGFALQISGGTAAAGTGIIRLPCHATTEYTISHRNAANTGDLTICAWDTNANLFIGSNTGNGNQISHTRVAASTDVKLVIGSALKVMCDATGVGFLGVATAGQQADVVAFTDNSGGTVSSTIAAITAGATYAQADMVSCKNAIASISSKMNTLRAVFRTFGFMA